MLFTPMLLAHWLQQLLSCVNHPSWDGSRVLTCFISDSTSAFYLELTHVISILRHPRTHPVPLCGKKSSSRLLYESFAIGHSSITLSFVMPSTRKGDFRSPPGVFLGVAVDCIRAIPRNLSPHILPISFPHYVEVYHVKLVCSDTNRVATEPTRGHAIFRHPHC